MAVEKKKRALKIPEIDEKTIQEIYGMASRGCNIKEIANFFDMTERTLHMRMKANPRIREMYGKGKSQAIISVSTKLYEKAMGDDINSLTAQIYFLKCKDPKNWNDRSFKQNDKSSSQIPVPVFRLSDEASREKKPKASRTRGRPRSSLRVTRKTKK